VSRTPTQPASGGGFARNLFDTLVPPPHRLGNGETVANARMIVILFAVKPHRFRPGRRGPSVEQCFG